MSGEHNELKKRYMIIGYADVDDPIQVSRERHLFYPKI